MPIFLFLNFRLARKMGLCAIIGFEGGKGAKRDAVTDDRWLYVAASPAKQAWGPLWVVAHYWKKRTRRDPRRQKEIAARPNFGSKGHFEPEVPYVRLQSSLSFK
jgi:hypothetical protein